MMRAYQFALEPTAEQAKAMQSHCGAQLLLPIQMPGVCGYCHGPLTLAGQGNAECGQCGTVLARISDTDQWLAFQLRQFRAKRSA